MKIKISKKSKMLWIFFLGFISLAAGLINAFSNPFYPCALTLIPASFIYFLSINQEKKIWEKDILQILLLTVGIGIFYAGLWELLVLTSWNDILHIFMMFTGFLFFLPYKYKNLTFLIGVISGLLFTLFIRTAYLFDLFSLSLNLKFPSIGENGSALIAWVLTYIISAFTISQQQIQKESTSN